MRRGALMGGTSAIVVALTMVTANPAGAQYPYSGYGPGMMGHGMMGHGMMGQGYMPWCPGCGMGPGMTGPGMMGPGMGMYGAMQPALNLTANDVKVYLERWIAGSGNPNIKVGNVVEKDTSTITADIVTKDNSLVQQFTVDRRIGFYRPAQ